MTRIGNQKMKKIIPILFGTLPAAAEVCSAAELLVDYIKEETFTQFPSLLGQQVALRPELSLLETFTMIRSADIQPATTSPSLITDS